MIHSFLFRILGLIMDIQLVKSELIKAISQLQNETVLQQLVIFLEKWGALPEDNYSNSNHLLDLARQPVPANIDLDQLKNEQGYSMSKIDSLFDSTDFSLWDDENVKDLLEIL